MKLLLPIFLLAFCLIQLPVHSEAVLSLASSQDTISRLEKRVELNLTNIQNTLDDTNSKLELIRAKISILDNDRKELKKTKNQALKLEKELQFNYQKQNAYRHLLTMIRQLKIQNETIADIQLKEIDKSLKVLDKNKLPKLTNLKPIPNSAYLRNQPAVYDKEISSLCNLTRSPDGKMIANVYENFFEFTDPNISTHFKDNDFLECLARFIKTKKDYFLELRFSLNSTKASAIYGTIDPSNPSKIDFIDGDFIYLETYALTSGTVDPETGNTIYNVQYKLSREDIKNIRKKDMNTITILWTSGADQFEICKIDLLRNMFECIQKRKLQN